jgi:hypothetical protein
MFPDRTAIQRITRKTPTTAAGSTPKPCRVRDAEVARMRALNVPFRLIGSRLGMSLGAQKSVRRSQKLADASGEARGVLAAVDDEMDAEDVASAADVEKLNVLERYRLRHVPGAFGDAERAASPGSPPGSTGTPEPEPPTVYPVRDRAAPGRSWREHCDAAMSDDCGTDAGPPAGCRPRSLARGRRPCCGSGRDRANASFRAAVGSDAALRRR